MAHDMPMKLRNKRMRGISPFLIAVLLLCGVPSHARAETFQLLCEGTGRVMKLGIGDVDKTIPMSLGVDLTIEDGAPDRTAKVSATITGQPVETPRIRRSMWGVAYPSPMNQIQIFHGTIDKPDYEMDHRNGTQSMDINRNTGIASYRYRFDDNTGIFSINASLKCSRASKAF